MQYIFIQNKENLEYARGNNFGIASMLSKKADYILVLNNDVIVEKKFIL